MAPASISLTTSVTVTTCIFITQLLILTSAENPVYILLKLENFEDPKYTSLKNPVVLKYEGKKMKPLDYKSATLCISGHFTVKENEEEDVMYWGKDEQKGGAEELAKIVSDIFPPDAVVIVVFPDTLQLYSGLEYLKKFEKKVQQHNQYVTVGREIINLYVGLSSSEMSETVKNLKNTQTDNPNYSAPKQNAIVVKAESNKFEFYSFLDDKWKSDLPNENVFQVLIQEADLVRITVLSKCTSDQNGLKVGSLTVETLAKKLHDLVKPETGRKHVHQKIQVKLSDSCKEKREEVTEELINKIRSKFNLKVFGKEPSVELNIGDPQLLRINPNNNDPTQVFAHIENQKINLKKGEQSRISNAKDLFIHIHCHSVLFVKPPLICGLHSQSLAEKLHEFCSKMLGSKKPETIQLTFYVCEMASKEGQKYINQFLGEFNSLNQNKQKKIVLNEIITLKFRVSDNLDIAVVRHTPYLPDNIYDNLKSDAAKDVKTNDLWQYFHVKYVNAEHVFGRFTVRTVSTGDNNIVTFRRLPATEYNLLYGNK